MPDPVLQVIAGPDSAGKSTLYEAVIGPATHLEFVNSDVIAAERRSRLLARRSSFITETGSAHERKVELVQAAIDAGYLVTLHVVMVPEALAVARVANRVDVGGHDVPEQKVRERYERLWPLLVSAIGVAERTIVYDNSRARRPFRVVARFERATLLGPPDWPPWTPEPLRSAGGDGSGAGRAIARPSRATVDPSSSAVVRRGRP